VDPEPLRYRLVPKRMGRLLPRSYAKPLRRSQPKSLLKTPTPRGS